MVACEVEVNDATPAKDLPKFMARLPADVRRWIRDEARRNTSSQNSEVVRSIRERMDRQAGLAPAVATEG